MSALNPSAEFYPNDIPENYLIKFEMQLENYNIRRYECFHGLENLVDLSVKRVETKRHRVYDMVYLLLKLVLVMYQWRQQVLKGCFLQ
jgi:hypothetical protein